MSKPKFGEIGYITYARTYARPMPKKGTEEFGDTVDRIISACRTQLNVGFTPEEEVDLRQAMFDMKGLVAGRFLWQLGTATVDRLGLMSLQNCAAVVVDDPIKPFVWAMDALMLGCGVGYNIQREYVYELPKVRRAKIVRKDTNDADFIIPDSREGWVELLQRTLEAHFITGKGFSFSTSCLRHAGLPIKGFGGVSSGPEPLAKGILQINEVLNKRAGKKARPIDCLDVMNLLGAIVVSGNVRRSAQIALGDMDDLQFLNAKRWDLGNIPNWRAMSNNSVVCSDFSQLPEQFWQGYQGNGEPYGLINLKLSREIGRAGDYSYPDPDVIGYNPSLRAGTKVWTSEGIRPIEELQDKEFVVRNLHGKEAPAKCWLSGKGKQLYEITLDNGFKYYCTPEHKWAIHTPQGYVKCETTDLQAGHYLPIIKKDNLGFGQKGSYDDGLLAGWMYGDGWMTDRDNHRQYGLIFSQKDRESDIHTRLLSHVTSITGNSYNPTIRPSGCLEINLRSQKFHEWATDLSLDKKEHGLPKLIWSTLSEDFRKGFIDGIVSSDGTIEATYKSAKIAWSSKHQKLAEDMQELLGFYGIKNSIHINHPKLNGSEFPQHCLQIATRENIQHFKACFSLSLDYKQAALDSISNLEKAKPVWGSHYQIKEVRLSEVEEDVWDVTVFDDTHCFQLSQCITGNCAEQSLANYETCCLAELFLPNMASQEELLKVATYLYRINKHSLSLACHQPGTQEIVHRHMRMGLGVSGYLQATEEQKSWLSPTYEALRAYDKEYSAAHGWPASIKLTTVKPSGTLSLLAGVTPGVHPGYAEHFIRRIRIASNSSLIQVVKDHGYPLEYVKNFDGTEDRGTMVASFPCKFPAHTVFAKDCTALDQLEYVKRLQTEWSDNAVSCTVYYRKEELPAIREWLLTNFNNNVKSVSFLLHSEHGFQQAPYEEITEEQYLTMKAKVSPINAVSISMDEVEVDECDQGHCPVR